MDGEGDVRRCFIFIVGLLQLNLQSIIQRPMTASHDFFITAASLQEWQSCRRKLLLREWKRQRWRPKALFDSCLRKGIVQLSHGVPVDRAASDARSQFLLIAADPGLDIIGDPWRESKDWCALLEVMLRWMGGQTIVKLADSPPVPLTGSTEWRISAWTDGERLHRWVTVAQWDQDSLSRELHSWRTIGDIVVTGKPMVLHALELGQYRNGRHLAAWSRAFYHPAMPSLRWRFIKPEDTTWKSVYFADQRAMAAEEWVEAAKTENALGKLSHEVLVNVPSEMVVEDTKMQMAKEAGAMRDALRGGMDYRGFVMSRGACDLYNSPCVYQPVCYSEEQVVQIDKLNLYVRGDNSRQQGAAE